MKYLAMLIQRETRFLALTLCTLAWAVGVPLAGRAEDGHDGHQEHEEEDTLRLTEEQRRRFGIEVRVAGPGSLHEEIRLSGEIVFNEDRLVHVVPRVAGIAREVHRSVGDPVKAGDVLAVIDSADLASAKLDYFSAETEVGCCQFELPRAEAVHDNVTALLALLERSPSVEALQEAAPGEMGDYRSRLISAYAEYVLTRKAYEREEALLAKAISSEGDFLAAESAFKKAQAAYFGTRDSVAYEVRQNLLEVTRDRRLSEFQAETAKQRLLMLGLSEDEVTALAGMLLPGNGETEAAQPCTDPNCTDCRDHASGTSAPGDPARLGWYEIKAPLDGFIVEKHIALGERVGSDTDIFTVVDTEQRVGQPDRLHQGPGRRAARDRRWCCGRTTAAPRRAATIAMVTPVRRRVDPLRHRAGGAGQQRRALDAGNVRDRRSSAPPRTNLPVVVPRDAVQNIEGRDVVFVEHEGAFEMTPVHDRAARTARASRSSPGWSRGRATWPKGPSSSRPR